MKSEEFTAKLTEASELMREEKYKDALEILLELKEIEKKGDFDYNLTHKLYQLISNTKSLYNQELVLKALESIPYSQISFKELYEKLQIAENIDFDISILKREIEILILRGKLSCEIDGENIILYSKS